MYSVSNNNFITLTRGDYFKIPLFINRGTKWDIRRFKISDYPRSSVYLGVMEANQSFEEAAIKKYYNGQECKKDYDNKTYKIVNRRGDIMVELNPSDTAYLLPGKYYYEVDLDLGDGAVLTVIPKTEFFILD